MDNNILENTPNSFLANLSSRLLQQSRVNQQYLSNSGPPSTLDLSEFPSLSGKSTNGNNNLMQSQNAPGSSRPAYVGIIKENVPSTTASEFTIHSEDFPALPGSNPNLTANTHETQQTQSTNQSSTPPTGGLGGHLSGLFNTQTSVNSANNNSLNSTVQLSSSLPNQSSQAHQQQSSVAASVQQQLSNSNNLCNQQTSSIQQSELAQLAASSAGMDSSNKQNNSIKRGIQTSKDGRVTNIPAGMVTDQYGMVGLLAFIRAAESDPSLVSLALGSDLTTLKLDLNSTESLFSTFPGPWSDVPLRPHEIDYSVPQEYLINNQIRDKLASVKLNRYGDDMLFFLFYLFPQDYIQAAAANELYSRDWRYHKDEKVWITRCPGKVPVEKTQTYERGTYYYFDVINWQKIAKEFYLDYDRLENNPVNIQNRLMNQQTS